MTVDTGLDMRIMEISYFNTPVRGDVAYFDGQTWTAQAAIPIGVILPFGGSSAPEGYFMCNGTFISRTTYADLFAVIGTNYGIGDGSTTFNVPDYRDRMPIGVSGTKAIGSTTNVSGAGTPVALACNFIIKF